MTAESQEAWIQIPTEAQFRAGLPPGATVPYDFGFIPAMNRLIAAHQRIGPAFVRLIMEVMFAPGHLSRREREMVAAVASTAQDCFY